ncbi:zf-HC2 domain-containing protein [Hymenobacter jeollabukensis]|uniref:Zf-HC2 domain-containing protein n=1 Tax=Hymenobacter jeollabukensis TaxID=2025313 RepID=A0A5R8WT31_9BACT|nr:zf-HC2 domain-containing protein [Hymenobacter jeollabukensis]
MFNCRQATLLIERRADETLPFKTQVQLRAHLRLCPYCRRYAFQSLFLARQARAAAEHRVPADVVLPPAARQRIQQALDQRLGR